MPVSRTAAVHGRVVVVFRNDDLSARSHVDHESRVAAIFERYGVPQTFGVIPRCATGSHHDPRPAGEVAINDNPAMLALLCRHVDQLGSEIALHGYTHRTNHLSIPRRREFSEFRGMSLLDQEDRIRRGIDLLGKTFGVRPATFIPPWNSMDLNTSLACIAAGLGIVSAGPFTPVIAPLMGLGVNCDIETFPGRIAMAVANGGAIILSVMYHSRTIRTPEQFASLEHAVRLAVETPACEVLTVAETVARYPELVTRANEAGRSIAPQTELVGSVRARATVYRRTLRWINAASSLERAYAAADVAYWAGRYNAVEHLNARIDQLCVRYLRACRGGVTFVGAVGGVSLSVCCSGRSWGDRVQCYLAGVVIAVVLALVTRWAATALDTKREIAVMCVAGCAGMMGGLILLECLRALLTQ